MSYIGLFSYYQYENWAYQPSYVSSNTPWFFQGLRAQFFPSDKLKLELWVINGWQSYGVFNNVPGVGSQLTWRPNGNLDVISNNYYVGKDTLGNPDRKRMHTDDSIQVKYYDNPEGLFDMAAFSRDDRRRLRVRRRRDVQRRQREDSGAVLPRFHALQPRLVREQADGLHARRRLHRQPRALPGAPAADQRGHGDLGHSVLHRRTRATSSRPGTPRSPSTTCRRSGARSAPSSTTGSPTSRTSPGAGGITPPGGNQGAPGSIVPGFTPDLVKSESRFTLGLLVRI